jgi:hypothetical protein
MPHRATKIRPAARPRRGAASTSQGHPRTVFRRALERGNLLVAEATAREVGRVSLAEALELTALIAAKESHRLPRVAARWLRRYFDEREAATLDEVALVDGISTVLVRLRPNSRSRPCGG